MTPSIKNNTKKVILTLLALLFISCGSSGGKKNDDKTNNNTPSTNIPQETTTPKKYSISGVIKDANTNALLSEATVSIPAKGSHTTNSKGEYEFRDIEENTLIQITVSKNGYVPSTKSITVQKNEILNFSLTPQGNIGNIQGTVLNDIGTVISGANINIAGKNTLSDSVGFYKLTSVASGLQQITVSKANHEAITQSVTIGLNTLTTKNITLKRQQVSTQLSFSISASKTTAQANENISFNVTNESSNIVSYEWKSNIAGVLSNSKTFSTSNLIIGTHTITCKATGSDGQTLSKNLQVAISQAQEKGLLNGVIRDSNNSPIQNATIKLGNHETTSSSIGFYSIPNIIYGSYSLFISKENYITNSQQININQNNKLKNIILYQNGESSQQPTTEEKGNIEGNIKDKITNENIKGATISIGNNNAISNDNGSYIITNLSYGTHRLKVSLNGYEINEQDITISQSNQIKDILLLKNTASLKGVVKNTSGTLLANVNLSLGTTNITTDTNGAYIINNITSYGERKINASLENYKDYQANIQITKGHTITHNITLEPKENATIQNNTGTTAIGDLMWQDNSDAKSIRKSWDDAKSYCSNLSLAGYNNWYLPNKSQLESLYKNRSQLENIAFSYYWSSSSYASNSSFAWVVSFNNGYTGNSNKTNSLYVRCVRGRQ